MSFPSRIVHVVRPALVLDLDGTVRRSRKTGSFVEDPDDVEIFPGVEAKLWEYAKRDFMIFGVTNQGGVAHGHKTPHQVDKDSEATCRAFDRNPFHTIKAALHDPRGTVAPWNIRSLFRKPGYGMLAELELECFARGVAIDWDASLFVGDRPEDEEYALAARVPFKWAWEFFEREAPPDAKVVKRTCDQVGCVRDATHSFKWPGTTDARNVCEECAKRAQAIAANTGWPLVTVPL